MSAMKVSYSQPDVCLQNRSIAMPNEFRQACSPADGFAVRDQGKRTGQLVQSRLGYTESDRKQDERGGSLMKLSSQTSYRSCIYFEVPLRSTISVLFLDKSLYISLVELEGRRAGQATLYRSTLSVRFGVSSCRRSSTDNKPAQINEGYGRSREAMLGRNKRNVRETGLGHCRSPLSKHRTHKVEQIALTHDVNSKLEESDTKGHSATLGLLSFRGPSPSHTKAGRQKENADEAAFPICSNFSHRRHTSNIGPVDSRTWTKQAGSDKTEERQEHDSSSEPPRVSDKTFHSRLKADSLQGTTKNLSLKEALERLRPDFISRSQGRLRRLEQRARRRRYLQDSNPDLVQGLREDRGKQKRNCTTPDPLSDNLFKPRERTISGKEMQLRSRRIYNQLPEVTKKKEEEKKRAVSQTNRLRADVFKKRLLDQILQK
ncbi:(E2-independent) E3 ubiquitin-conjugating enzyme FATS [Anoplopoma fimbria]|uniref:(E2-independent) E3 ubiquitin-conjugating enzyme FATS n=1 Tax=Anoplopoma fimbria TaxID=229290 RepID=UPI0023EC122A|nr:(E2-independent) E3 ubiquitin-conjugating enzyme FATS [Anoplopoma fimbria]